MKNIGLIGAGGYAYVYVDWFLRHHEAGEINYAGVVIRPQDRAAIGPIIDRIEEAKVPVYPDKDALFNGTPLDLVALPIAIPSHCPLTVEALTRGINVIVEKPAAGSLEEIARMRDAERRSGKFAAVGFQHTYEPNIHDLKNMLIGGRFGRIRKIVAMGRWPRADRYYRRNEWVCRMHSTSGEPIYDSPINNAFAHYLNLALFLSGDDFGTSSHAVGMQAELYRARKTIETFDTCGVRLKTANGVEIVCLFTHACEENVNPKLRIECDDGVIVWTECESWSAVTGNGEKLKASQPPSNGFSAMQRLLLRKLEGERVFTYPLELAMEHTACIEMLHRLSSPVDVRADCVEVRPEDGQHIIRDISRIFDRCFDDSTLPSEAGAKWR